MGMAPDNRTTIPLPKRVSTSGAVEAIHALQLVADRLEANRGHDRLQACIAFAQEALWAAAYPNDPNTMLDQVADQAQSAMG